MMKRRHLFLPALGAVTILSGSLLVAGVRQQPATGSRGAEPTAAPRGPAASLARPTSPTKAADAAGFLQRWLLLEPIKVSGQLTDSAVRATIQKEYFPGQFSALPHDGDTVTVAGAGDSLTWHAVDTLAYNVNLYHFAYALNKPTSNVLFWAVTIVNAPRDMAGVRLAIGSNAASIWWLNGAGTDRHLQRPAGGRRRRRVEARDAEEGIQCHPGGDHQCRRRDRLLRAVSRRRGASGQRTDTQPRRQRAAAVARRSTGGARRDRRARRQRRRGRRPRD